MAACNLNYAVIPAPGHHGDRLTVHSAHKTAKAAKVAAQRFNRSSRVHKVIAIELSCARTGARLLRSDVMRARALGRPASRRSRR